MPDLCGAVLLGGSGGEQAQLSMQRIVLCSELVCARAEPRELPQVAAVLCTGDDAHSSRSLSLASSAPTSWRRRAASELARAATRAPSKPCSPSSMAIVIWDDNNPGTHRGAFAHHGLCHNGNFSP